MLGSAGCAKGRAATRLREALKNLACNAQRRLLRLDLIHRELLLGIEGVKLRPETPATHGNHTDAAPLTITLFEDLVNRILSRAIAFEGHAARIRIDNLDLTRLEQLHRFQNAADEIERLEAGDRHGDLKLIEKRGIFVITHHRADMT